MVNTSSEMFNGGAFSVQRSLVSFKKCSKAAHILLLGGQGGAGGIGKDLLLQVVGQVQRAAFQHGQTVPAARYRWATPGVLNRPP